MWLISARDLVFRRRRFVVAVLVTALVFGLALVFDGVKRAVRNEVPRTVSAFDADAWLVKRGVTGPFTTTAVFPADVGRELAGAPGVERADPVVLTRGVARVEPDTDVNIVGHVRGGLGSPPVTAGRPARSDGEVVVDDSLGLGVGDDLRLGDRAYEVVGVGEGLRYNFGAPTVYVTLRDAQRITFGGQDLVGAVAIRGRPDRVPDGFVTLSNAQVADDLRRITKSGVQTIDFVSIMLWLITAGIIGSIVYLNATERTRDFAVLKATGSPNRTIVGGLAVQSLFLALLAAVLGVVIAQLLALGLPFAADIEVGSYVQLFVVAAVIGLLASLVGARRALTTDPALAFGGA